ncbi:MAG: dihydroxyacetone kinase [Firmicutes bacterium HGW-Firmicutes-15]|nr:MAG: dihydroxyacetone kinase [Firmicutes bacterium HGW-Firmicutes-15]
MSLLSINGNDLIRSVKAGCIRLEHNREQVDLLNVFPVPDGDTGTNMYLTLLAAVKEGEKHQQEPLGKVAKAISMGSLMGARGNSGVIMSQIFRGIAKVLEGKEEANAIEVAQALRAGSETAYKAVMKPVEGTILTVIREIAGACEKEANEDNDILASLLTGIQVGYRTLEKTPTMLPILKEAGVVDAGGRGLIYFLEGLVDGLAHEKDIILDVYKEKMSSLGGGIVDKAPIELAYNYCTEVLVKGGSLDVGDIKDHLSPLGDSMLVVGDEDLVKVHIHSNHPGKVLETCLQFGSLSDIKVNNMLEEVHEQRNNWEEEKTPKPNKIGLVAVGVGDGIIKILKNLGVDEVVEGGQTMNPSTEDLFNACNEVDADQIIILPNNGNVIMAAEQVKHLCEKQVEIVPTRSVMQSISALIAYNSAGDLAEVVSAMNQEMQNVRYAEVTYAVRDSAVNGLDIKEGDIIGIINGKISLKGTTVEAVVLVLMEEIQAENSELITLFYGADIIENQAMQLKGKLMGKYPDSEVEMHYGGQPHYSYLLSVE